MFKKGDRIHLHDGRVVTVRRRGVPKIKRGPHEHAMIRGFIRGELVDMVTGERQTGEYHENVITTYGHGVIVKNFVGIQLTHTSAPATIQSDLGLARYWGIGYHTQAQSSNFSTQSAIDSTEYILSSALGGASSRATVSAGSQVLSGTWTLSQSYQYASSQISHAQTVNCIAQYAHASRGSGTALSLATFQSSTKGTTQALNVTYNFVFST